MSTVRNTDRISPSVELREGDTFVSTVRTGLGDISSGVVEAVVIAEDTNAVVVTIVCTNGTADGQCDVDWSTLTDRQIEFPTRYLVLFVATIGDQQASSPSADDDAFVVLLSPTYDPAA